MNSNLSTLILQLHEKSNQVVGIDSCYPSIIFDTVDTDDAYYYQVTIKWGRRDLVISKKSTSPHAAAKDALFQLNELLYNKQEDPK